MPRLLVVALFFTSTLAAALDLPEALIGGAQQAIGEGENLIAAPLAPGRFVPGPPLHPVMSVIDGLSDLDGRATTGVRPEELSDTVQRELRQQRCRLMGSGLEVDFGHVDGGSQLSHPLNLLVQCPQGTQFRFTLLQGGIPANQAQVSLVDSVDTSTPAHLSFTTTQGIPLNQAVYTSDGQPRAIALTAHLHRLPGAGPLAGELRLLSPLELTLIVD